MQVKKRNNYITIICGEKGTGKTTFALNLLEKNTKKNAHCGHDRPRSL
jgi:septin family protein